MTGGRFNPVGVPALYLALDVLTAIKEATRGNARRIDPLVLCSYEIDCEDIADLTTDIGRGMHDISLDTMNVAWNLARADGQRPASWSVHDRLAGQGVAGVVVPSFAPGAGAGAGDRNLVLWNWGPDLPHRVEVFDPSGRLPKNQLSWE